MFAGWGGSDGQAFAQVSVCVCARAPAHVHMCTFTYPQSHSPVLVCAFWKGRQLSVSYLAVHGTVGGSLVLSANEWLLQRFGAVIAQPGIADALSLRPPSLA